jgi:hypothetical protein
MEAIGGGIQRLFLHTQMGSGLQRRALSGVMLTLVYGEVWASAIEATAF